MDKLEAMRLFVRVVETGGFTSAARDEGVPTSRVSRAVSALEEDLGASLLHRTTRAVRLTDAGETYLGHVRTILGAVEQAHAELSGREGPVSGRVVFTLPLDLSGELFRALVDAFLAQHPEVTLEAMVTNRMVDLVAEGVDVALRAGELPDSSLKARKIGTTRHLAVASPAYLARKGTPAHPADLADHDGIAYHGGRRSMRWPWPESPWTMEGPVAADDWGVIRQAALAGHGIAICPPFVIRDDLAAGRLTCVLAHHPLPANPLHLVLPPRRFTPPAVRAFVDHLADVLGPFLDTVEREVGGG